MAIPKSTKDFIDRLIDYYISEASSYRQIAEEYIPEINSVPDTAFGIITGLVYAEFLQIYKNQQKKLILEDIREFTQIIKQRAPIIKKAILEGAQHPDVKE